MKRILLYGAGDRFHEYFEDGDFVKNVIEDSHIEIVGICDRNSKLWGKKIAISGKTYLYAKISELNKRDWDYIIITSNKHYNSIKEDLIKGGFEKHTIWTLEDFLYEMLFQGEYLYKLSLVLIIRNEAEYICEWIEYHKLAGVEHFYIYDNQSTDNLKDILSKYVKKGEVSYHFWKGGQTAAYDHAVSNYKLETKYMGFIDTDEFIVPKQGKNLYEIVDNILLEDRKLMPYPKANFSGGVGINWKTYGTSGHKTKPEGLVIENYKYCASVRTIKTIANPRTIKKCSVHNMDYIRGYECISENGSSIPGHVFFDAHYKKLQINHYYSKSEEELRKKICRGTPTTPEFHRTIEEGMEMTEKFRKRYDECLERARTIYNAEYDYIMDKNVEKVKKILADK